METKHKSFEELLEYGNIAENMVFNALKQMGFYSIPKYLYNKEGSPSIFGLYSSYAVPDIDTAKDGFRFWIEVKRKSRRIYYPDTGFPLKNYESYLKIQEITGNEVFILFVDEKNNACYGNWLNNIKQPFKLNKKIYPLIEGDYSKIIYFPIALMCNIQNTFTDSISMEGMNNLYNCIMNKH